jgi:hypothetical protein
VDADAQRFQFALQHAGAGLVELPGHEAGRKFHHVRFQAQVEGGLGGFQAQQPAPDHGRAAGPGGVRPDGFQVFDGAVHEHPVFFGAGNGGHERGRAGCQHQFVVGGDPAVRRGDPLAGAVDAQHQFARVQVDVVVEVPVGRGQCQRLAGGPRKVAAQVHPVVGRAGLFAEYGEAKRVRIGFGQQFLAELVAYHAIADYQDVHSGLRKGLHLKRPIFTYFFFRYTFRKTAFYRKTNFKF